MDIDPTAIVVCMNFRYFSKAKIYRRMYRKPGHEQPHGRGATVCGPLRLEQVRPWPMRRISPAAAAPPLPRANALLDVVGKIGNPSTMF